MKCILLLLCAASFAAAQTDTASLAGKIVDAKTEKPIPAALVTAIRADAPALNKTTRSGGDGAFKIDRLPSGKYSLCVQASDEWLDPCQWNETATGVVLASGQAATGVSIKLPAASNLHIEVQDTQNLLKNKTKDGRRPDLAIGVWGPEGLYHPARATSGPRIADKPLPAGKSETSYTYRPAIPPDVPLKLHISSRDLRLGDGAGAALAGNASQQAFQRAAGDVTPKSFVFTVLGLLP